MQSPIRLLDAVRSGVPVGLVAAAALGSVVFAATPFLLGPLDDEYGVGLGAVGLASTLQFAGFVAGSWLAPKLVRPRRLVAVAGVLATVTGNGLAALLPPWPVLLALRFLSGLGLGIIAWMAWREAFGNRRRTAELSLAAPLATMVATPILAWLSSEHGAAAVFAGLAAVVVIPLALPLRPTVGPVSRELVERRAGPPVRPALLLLVALGAFSCGGSAVFVYSGVIAVERVGLGTAAISVAFVLNSVSGVAAGFLPRLRRGSTAGLWATLCAGAAGLMAVGTSSVTFVAAMMLWGFSFFVAVPSMFGLLSERSRWPDERAGDAQAIMAVGRVAGPAIGGLLVAGGSLPMLGIAAVVLMGGAGLTAAVVFRKWDAVPTAPDAVELGGGVLPSR